MTKEEAIVVLECMATNLVGEMAGMRETDPRSDALRRRVEAIDIAQAALRPVSREQVEKVWKGEWENSECTMLGDVVCGKCGVVFEGYYESYQFCPRCGVPMTGKAVQMMIERLEALKDD